MAYTTKSAFLCIALVVIFLATTAPKSDALSINGINVLGIAVLGTARCSSNVTGTCTTCAPIPNLRVALRLAGNDIASAITAPNGSFRIDVSKANILTGLNDIDSLRVVISLPIAGCPLWAAASTGHLEGTPVLQTGDNVVAGVANLVVPWLVAIGI